MNYQSANQAVVAALMEVYGANVTAIMEINAANVAAEEWLSSQSNSSENRMKSSTCSTRVHYWNTTWGRQVRAMSDIDESVRECLRLETLFR